MTGFLSRNLRKFSPHIGALSPHFSDEKQKNFRIKRKCCILACSYK